MFISMVAFAKIIDHMLGLALGFFHYVELGKITYFYAFFYDITVYPTIAVMFCKLFPRGVAISKLIKYNLFWIIFSFLFESIIAYPFGIMIYTGWKIFPFSLLFYCGAYPVITWYKLFLEKKLGFEKK
ncbi:hypothetical protein Bccel_3152 [Pseudobacteroides cellulosolvens ATCC 35603 = DSM 2933]|uniref:Uncharacterized protein n=1 Tax=Pseudobacteroides cellulosolvens ATCC 35603 = DSM 2933 TaxID=398512 RepID=A0A0L6JPW3_9FIRM|nr:hypothetical protein Bccel_3152 [Pseudobacteroides cellulosolvens ATCC 35603 = DSM 2933]